ncbi:MAG: hypothetical protein QOI41_4879 [Myxococcales bacterium]|nr:hypothetical protein [Myxococcales bacterium]
MTCLRGSALVLVIALGMLLNGAVARADAATPSLLVLDEPKSGIHIELPGACLAHVKNAAMGRPTCPDRAPAGESEALAVVGGDGGGDGKGAHYSVDIVVDEIALDTGEDRAKRMTKELSEAMVEPPTIVTFADQRFVRARLRWTNGGGVCFVTADDRKEAAAVIFLSLDAESAADVERNADAAMATLRRAPVKGEPSPRASKSGGSDAVFIAFGVLALALLGLFVFAKFYFIARLFGFKLGGSAERRTEDPRGPRDPEKDGPQVAGMKCAACRRNIVSDREGMHCADCDRPIHKECHGKHVTAAHVATPGAYR